MKPPILLFWLAACGSPAPRPPEAGSRQEPSTLHEGPATLRGTAQNAKAGAILEIRGEGIYVDGLDAWPEDLLGSAVTVTGTLERRVVPDPARTDGLRAGGLFGEIWILVGAAWSR